VLVAGVLGLVLVAVVLVGVRVLGGGEARAGVPVQDRPGTVVLVPGYGGSQDGLRVLAERIRSSGREVRIVTLPGSGTGDLLAQVAGLNRDVDDALARGAPSVDVIGYSAGGLVARLWVAG
jgi:triacylglycerol lipase